MKVIIKTEKFNGKDRIILFFPDCTANPGLIAFCSPEEGHGEASLDYYRKCKPCRDADQCAHWIKFYNNLPGDCTPLVQCYRQTYVDRQKAWQRIN